MILYEYDFISFGNAVSLCKPGITSGENNSRNLRNYMKWNFLYDFQAPFGGFCDLCLYAMDVHWADVSTGHRAA